MDNFFKKILFKILDPMLGLDSSTVRNHAKRLRKTAISETDDVHRTADTLMRISGLLALIEWVYSDESPEELE